jgi:putative ABC transport system ATP-binding protein
VNLTVESGEIVLIAGRNGCGKTTILNIAGCLDIPSKGTVSIKGRSIGGLSEKELSEIRLRTIGFVFQDHNLIEELTVAQNVMLPLRLAKADQREERTRKMLESFGLLGLSSRRPMELSTGQRQLVAVARAFANGPSVLLADEPTASLDEENRSRVLDALCVANEMGAALLMTCHANDSKNALKGGRQFVMRDGSLWAV